MDYIYEVGFYDSRRHRIPSTRLYYKSNASVEKWLNKKKLVSEIRVKYFRVSVGDVRYFKAKINEVMRIKKVVYEKAYDMVYGEYFKEEDKKKKEEKKVVKKRGKYMKSANKKKEELERKFNNENVNIVNFD